MLRWGPDEEGGFAWHGMAFVWCVVWCVVCDSVWCDGGVHQVHTHTYILMVYFEIFSFSRISCVRVVSTYNTYVCMYVYMVWQSVASVAVAVSRREMGLRDRPRVENRNII